MRCLPERQRGPRGRLWGTGPERKTKAEQLCAGRIGPTGEEAGVQTGRGGRRVRRRPVTTVQDGGVQAEAPWRLWGRGLRFSAKRSDRQLLLTLQGPIHILAFANPQGQSSTALPFPTHFLPLVTKHLQGLLVPHIHPDRLALHP